MSLSISGNKFVRVYDPSIKLNFSDKVVFANLVTSRKTGNPKVDKETGEIVVNPATGKAVDERVYSRWEGDLLAMRVKQPRGCEAASPLTLSAVGSRMKLSWVKTTRYMPRALRILPSLHPPMLEKVKTQIWQMKNE